jgi:hypothetical protein
MIILIYFLGLACFCNELVLVFALKTNLFFFLAGQNKKKNQKPQDLMLARQLLHLSHSASLKNNLKNNFYICKYNFVMNV